MRKMAFVMMAASIVLAAVAAVLVAQAAGFRFNA